MDVSASLSDWLVAMTVSVSADRRPRAAGWPTVGGLRVAPGTVCRVEDGRPGPAVARELATVEARDERRRCGATLGIGMIGYETGQSKRKRAKPEVFYLQRK